MAKIKYEGNQKQNLKKKTMQIVDDDDDDDDQPVYPVEEEYNVEYLYGKKYESGFVKYCVKWENYSFDDSSFEPVENLENVVYNMRGFERKMSDLIFRVALLQNAKKKLPPYQVNPIQPIQKENTENNSKEQKKEKSQEPNHLQKEPSVVKSQTNEEKPIAAVQQQSPKKAIEEIPENLNQQNQQSFNEVKTNTQTNTQKQKSVEVVVVNQEQTQNVVQQTLGEKKNVLNGNSYTYSNNSFSNNQYKEKEPLSINPPQQSSNLLNNQQQSYLKQQSNGYNQNSFKKQNAQQSGNGLNQKKTESQTPYSNGFLNQNQSNKLSQNNSQNNEKNRRSNTQEQYIQTKLDQNFIQPQKQIPKSVEDSKVMEVPQNKNKNQLQFRDPVLESELQSNGYSAQVIVDETSKYGNFDNGDIPLKIQKHAPYTRIQKVIGNNIDLPSCLYFKVQFKPRPSGTIPYPTYIAFNELKDRYPRVLMEYYEKHAILLDPLPEESEQQVKVNSDEMNVKNDSSMISNNGNNKKFANCKEIKINI